MTDPVSIARNGLSKLEKREAMAALRIMSCADSSLPFAQLVKAMSMRECGSPEATEHAVTALAAEPAMLLQLCPWLARGPMLPASLSGLSLQVAISLRQFRRDDLKGWAVINADARGVRLPNGTRCLPQDYEEGEGDLCLIDGKRVPSISRHVRSHGISPHAYREFFSSARNSC